MSSKLQFTQATGTSTKKFTFSCWVKVNTESTQSGVPGFFSTSNGWADGTGIAFAFSSQQLRIYMGATGVGGSNMNRVQDRLFRDQNAWYHLVFQADTDESAIADRMKVYVNGTQQTITNVGGSDLNLPAQGASWQNLGVSGQTLQIGSASQSNQYFDGIIAHAHFCDGYSYPASTFGQTDATTGIWKPTTSPSVSYGTNGFFLKFDNSGNMGLDSSGQGNNLTTSGTIIQTKDSPSNVFAAWNPLHFTEDRVPNTVFKNVNTTFDSNETGSGVYTTSFSTLAASSGKYYCEYKTTQAAGAGNMCIGIGEGDGFESYFGAGTNSVIYLGDTGQYRKGGSDTSYGDTYGVGDIIGVALDLDNNKLYFSKNGTWQNSGDPTSGSTGTGAISISAASATTTGFYHFGVGDKSSSGTCEISANFGNGYFGTTAVSSAQNPDDGIGIFEYDVPAGYRALCTKSLNAQEYS